MTLKAYLEKQMRQSARTAMEAKEDLEKRNKFLGRYDAYVDILLTCSDDVLQRKVTNEIW